MKEKIVAANWKMHKNAHEIKAYAEELFKLIPVHFERNIYFYPQAITIETLKNTFISHHFRIGAQNCHYELEGAFTGEISPKTIKDYGLTTTLVGHSERRQYFGETNKDCAQKIKSLQSLGITPMYCVGEKLEERKNNQTFLVLEEQLKVGLEGADFSKKIIIAYEPVWAIGTGEVATPQQAQEAHLFIRNFLNKLSPKNEISILYGGSVKPENAKELINEPDIDGFLVGGASLKANSFAEICKFALSNITATHNN